MNTGGTDPIEKLLWIDLPEDIDLDMGVFRLNPAVPLPIEPEDGETIDIENVTWDKIVAACLLVLANEPSHIHAAYYREFLTALRPELTEELLEASQGCIADGDWSSAEDVLLALRGFAPESAAAMHAMARYYDLRSKSEASEAFKEAAEAAYSELLSDHIAPAEAWFDAGEFRYRCGDFRRSLETLEYYLDIAEDGENVSEARRMVSLCRDQGQADDLYMAAYTALNEGRLEEGTELAREFRDGKPGGWPGWFLLGWALRLSERWEEARIAFEGAVHRGCAEGSLFNELAMCLRALGDYESSAKALEQALRRDPENIKILSNMAVLQLERGNEAEALRWLNTALTMDPDDPVCKSLMERIEDKE